MPQDPHDPTPRANLAYEARQAEWKLYTYEEFSRDLGEIRNRRMEDLGSDFGALFRNGQRLKEYLDEFYEEPHSIRNHWSFTMASEHIARHFADYEAEGLGEAGDGEFFLSEGLQRAIHWYFAVIPRDDWRHDDDSVGRILKWTWEWMAAHPKK